MQGNLQEIDIRSILQLIELGQRTGELLITSDKSNNQDAGASDYWEKCQQKYWFVFFLHGQIIYCQEGDGDELSRIEDYLHHYHVEMRLDKQQLVGLSKDYSSEYGYLWLLLERNMINPKIAESIIYRLVCETLFDLLSLHQGNFIFRQDSAIAPRLTSWEVSPLVTQITQQLQEWNQLYPYIRSPEQLPVLADRVHLYSSLPESTMNKLQQWADGKTTLRQLARYLNRDILKVAKTIYPYIQQGWLKLTYPKTNNFPTNTQIVSVAAKKKVKILCIDDRKTICETIESILPPQGYEAMGYAEPEIIAITNPLQALGLIFQLQPNLVLYDITIPELDAYEFCAMLRQSQVFRYIPMIMLSSKDKFVDRIRGRMVGATDYLTKPFKDAELLMLVEKYINV